MTAFFLACALLGGVVLVLQLAATLFGMDHDAGALHDVGGIHAAEEGLSLFSVRAIAAGVAFLGVGGLVGARYGLVAALLFAIALGAVALFAVAWATRAMLRLEDDGTLRIQGAIGATANVYLTIPAARSGAGKVHVTLQNRLVELRAVTTHADALPTGARVMVVDVVDDDTVDVVPDPITTT